MTAPRFTARPAHDANFQRSLRALFGYRDLGVAAATAGATVGARHLGAAGR
jgi:hypothetical protein